MQKKDIPLAIYSSNFDFQVNNHPNATKLFKLHGTIDKDISDGINSRIVVTETDYDNTVEFREVLFQTFKNDLMESNLVIIGYSLSDIDIKDIVNKAIEINNKSYNSASIF